MWQTLSERLLQPWGPGSFLVSPRPREGGVRLRVGDKSRAWGRPTAGVLQGAASSSIPPPPRYFLPRTHGQSFKKEAKAHGARDRPLVTWDRGQG